MSFFEGLGGFWVCLGNSLGLLESLLGGFCIQKPKKIIGFFKVFENAGFWIFEVSDGLLGLTLAPLGPK